MCDTIPYQVDRKSTRLNSSHITISYAVFCLKKKRRQEVTTAAGLDVVANLAALSDTRTRMNHAKIEASLFISPAPTHIESSARTGSQFIELNRLASADIS